MFKWLLKNFYVIYLGAILGYLFNINMLMWQWWVIMIPTIILCEISKENENK